MIWQYSSLFRLHLQYEQLLQNPDENTHVLFHQVKKAYDLVMDLKLKELANNNDGVQASGVLPLYAKALSKSVQDHDWEEGWEVWYSIQAVEEPLPVQFFGEIMTNVFRLCYGDHEANRLYAKRRQQLTDYSQGESVDANKNLASVANDDWYRHVILSRISLFCICCFLGRTYNSKKASSLNVLKLCGMIALFLEMNRVALAIHVIHDAQESGTVTADQEALEDCFTKLLWVAKDNQDVDSANKINDAIVAHGLPSNIGQVIMQELYREVYHTRGI